MCAGNSWTSLGECKRIMISSDLSQEKQLLFYFSRSRCKILDLLIQTNSTTQKCENTLNMLVRCCVQGMPLHLTRSWMQPQTWPRLQFGRVDLSHLSPFVLFLLLPCVLPRPCGRFLLTDSFPSIVAATYCRFCLLRVVQPYRFVCNTPGFMAMGEA